MPLVNTSAIGAALTRFGCCTDDEVEDIAAALRQKGTAVSERNYSIRLISFGTTTAPLSQRDVTVLSLRHVMDYLRSFVSASWNVFSCHATKDTTIAQLVMVERARRSDPSYFLFQR